jgi:hypothetical protein
VEQVYFELAALTVACVSVDVDNLFDGGVTLFVCTSSATSSSISVVSVPFDVTGEGPTISKGLFMPAPLTEEAPSIELGRRLEEPAELCADLQARNHQRLDEIPEFVHYIQRRKPRGIGTARRIRV